MIEAAFSKSFDDTAMAQSAMISKVIVFVIATARLVHMRKTGSYA